MLNMKSNNPLISVIVPVYKVEEYLDECIVSIINQTYKNLEIILVDDGSPDTCPKMCDDWVKRDSRIRVIHKRNGGLSDARNAGLDVCCGEYIAFVDSDDYIASELYENLFANIIETSSDISVSKIFNLENGKVTEYDKSGNILKDTTETMTGMEYLKSYIGGKIENASWNKLYRRECFSNIRFKVGRNNEDFLMFYDMCREISRISFVDYFGYYYRQREGSIVHDPNRFLYYDVIKNIEEIRDDIKESGNAELIDLISIKELQERIIFMKEVMQRHKLLSHFYEFFKNFFKLWGVHSSFYKKMDLNFHKPYFVLKYCPFLYEFK